MIAKVLSSDLLKVRKKMIWFLIFLGPFGVIALQAVNFGVRYDYLTNYYAADLWGGLLENIQQLATPTLVLGIAIITSMIANIEHQVNSWKQLLALPVSRITVFSSKLYLSAMLLFLSCLLLGIGSIILGFIFKFGVSIPYIQLLKVSFYPFFAALPILTLQIWLSIVFKNQAIPLTIGILGGVLSMYSIMLPDWIFWKWPMLINDWSKVEYTVLAGILVGMIIFMLSLIDFGRRDVN
ncbi:ABC transporter permease [Cytobacillus sp. IB215316]|uniref:ABC transporter permease n=1 Tax=Cytobacillus sp. IB215316 TaxID=3097354 RepID=UPI002A10C95A|nr:ABC transporter permease [Cytobacillus sp. IB215316]MDX8361591.1 ABC transporter permease [Cytobacillus sp. IB215316]